MKAPKTYLMKLQINLLCLSKFEANSTEGWTLLKGKLFLHEHKKTWIHDQMHCTKIFINLCFTWTFHGWNKAISDYIRSTSFISVIGECVNVESNMNAAQQRHIRVIILTSGNAVLHTNTAPLWFVTFHLSSMVSLPIPPRPESTVEEPRKSDHPKSDHSFGTVPNLVIFNSMIILRFK